MWYEAEHLRPAPACGTTTISSYRHARRRAAVAEAVDQVMAEALAHRLAVRGADRVGCVTTMTAPRPMHACVGPSRPQGATMQTNVYRRVQRMRDLVTR